MVDCPRCSGSGHITKPILYKATHQQTILYFGYPKIVFAGEEYVLPNHIRVEHCPDCGGCGKLP